LRLPPLSLVLGGAASGKSAFAEGLMDDLARDKIYVATARALDAEMQARIAQHQAVRDGKGWHLVEVPLDLAGALAVRGTGQVALVDCATLWLSNLMMAGQDWQVAMDALLARLDRAGAPVVIVSNEVGQGIVPDTPLGRQFRNAHGAMNQCLATQADMVVQVIAGLPHLLKGDRLW